MQMALCESERMIAPYAHLILTVKPTLPDAIQPKGPLRIAQMAVRDHIRHPMHLQHQTGRNFSWSGSLPSTFVRNRDGASFSDRCRQHLEACRWLNSEHWSISEREWLRDAHHISNGVDGGYVFQHRQKDRFDQARIGQRPVFSFIGNVQRDCHVLQTVAWPCGIEPPCHVQCVKYTMGRTCDAQSYEGYGQKAQVKKGIVRQKDGIGRAEKLDALGDDLFNGGLSLDPGVGDAMHLLDVRGDGDVRIDELLEGGQFATVQSKAYSSYFDQSLHDREQACGFGVEGHNSDIGET